MVETGPDNGWVVVLLHGFPQFWWSWRHVLPVLGEAGHRTIAMDLRGVGGSDKPPRGYDTPTLVRDVTGVVRGLGANRAVLVAAGWSSWIAWAAPVFVPPMITGIAVVGGMHPLPAYRSTVHRRHLRGLARVAQLQVPRRPEYALQRGGLVRDLLDTWSGGSWPSEPEVRRYEEAMRIPAAAHCSLESFRWAARSRLRPDGARFRSRLDTPLRIPVRQLHGTLDGAFSPDAARMSGVFAQGGYEFSELPSVGHFLADEAPQQVSDALLDWLDRLPST